MPRDVTLDNPVNAPEEDEFNRWPFSQRLAETIMRLDASEGAPVLGLFGRWGSGKSTVLNFVRHALGQKHADQAEVLPFNPWLLKDTDALLEEFFTKLAASMNFQLKTSGQQIGVLMKRYGAALGMVPVIGTGAGKVVENFGAETATISIEARRDRLIAAMKQAPKRIVIIIDDLDRLDSSEVMAIMKLVRLSANFPNVVYLLALDEERVSRVAGVAFGDPVDGQQFLEKIIQYPFSLPAVTPPRLTAYVVKQARLACDSAELTLDSEKWDNFKTICESYLLSKLQTPRQAIRYGNALRFALPMLKGEVYPFDQMIVEALRMFFPSVYSHLRSQTTFEPQAIRDFLERREFEKMNDEDKLTIRGLVEVLKPSMHGPSNGIGQARYYGRYFSYSVADDDFSDAELETLINLAYVGDPTSLSVNLSTMLKNRSLVLLSRLLATRKKDMELETAAHLAAVLAEQGQMLSSAESMDESKDAQLVAEQIAKLALPILMDGRPVAEAGWEVLKRAKPLPFALVIFLELDRLYTQTVQEQIKLFDKGVKAPELDWEMLRAPILSAIAAEAKIDAPYNKYARLDALRILQFWHNWHSEEEAAWAEQRLSDYPDEATLFVALPGGNPTITYDWIAELANPDSIIRALRRSKGENLSFDEGDFLKKFIEKTGNPAPPYTLEHD